MRINKGTVEIMPFLVLAILAKEGFSKLY